MNRPEKIQGLNFATEYQRKEFVGYNQAIDEYEKFLPNKKELEKIISKSIMDCDGYIVYDIVESILKRLGGEK